MALLDAYGRPLQLRTLTQAQATGSATGGITGVRQVWTDTVASGLTPQRLAAVLRACDQGELSDFLTLAEEMEERDPHYGSVLGIRKRAISGVVPHVVPGSDDTKGREIAEAVEAHIAEHDGFPDLVEDMLDSLGKGFSVVEIHWAADKSRWWPELFERVEPRWLTYDRDTGRELRLRSDSSPIEGIPLAPGHFIRHEARLKSGLAFRNGLARVVAFSWMCKAYTLKDWIAFIETYGLPLRLGRYGPEATAEDVRKLFQAVANIGTDAAAVLPKSMQIDFERGVAVQGDGVFETFARWADEQISKAVLGQTMTSDNGSSQSQANVHNEVRHDIARADARSVAGALNRDAVRPFVQANWGEQERYPRIVIEIPEPEDTAAIMTAVPALAAAGVRFRAAEIRSKLGFSDPGEKDEVIGGAPAAPPTAQNHSGCRCPTCRGHLALNREIDPPADPLDEIGADALAEWEEVQDDLLGPVERAILDAATYEEAMAALTAVLPEMAASRLIDTLVQASFKARALGDVQDG
ncbi:DUF935 domain-containing protein [Cereibacter changlensis JA139]|uniref:DUF935 domain-containing protein n=2 Tax=Cereibacter changlensis TaxID=402884 RepID=A0A2T4JQP2_9RHOB|nr:DUF935 domain-containing protein [Cereibacter changlensis]PTE20235.1 DUF935 domain-containing protein [Cereibacter changlensis JA139]PZX47765.1 phage gp29-like protein [Cereibacter changlensis]